MPDDTDDELPDGWRVSGWSRRIHGIDVAVNEHQHPEDPMLATLPDQARERLLADRDAKRFMWSIYAPTANLHGFAPKLGPACRAAEEAAADLLPDDPEEPPS